MNKIHHENHEKLESGMNKTRTNPSKGKNPKKHLSRRLALVTGINNDTTQLYT